MPVAAESKTMVIDVVEADSASEESTIVGLAAGTLENLSGRPVAEVAPSDCLMSLDRTC